MTMHQRGVARKGSARDSFEKLSKRVNSPIVMQVSCYLGMLRRQNGLLARELSHQERAIRRRVGGQSVADRQETREQHDQQGCLG